MRLSDYLATYPDSFSEILDHYHVNIAYAVRFLNGEGPRLDFSLSPSEWAEFVNYVAFYVEEGDEEAVVEFCQNSVESWIENLEDDEELVELTEDMIVSSEEDVDNTLDDLLKKFDIKLENDLTADGLKAWKAKNLVKLPHQSRQFIDYLVDSVLKNEDADVNTVPRSIFEDIMELHREVPLDPPPTLEVVDPRGLDYKGLLDHLLRVRENLRDLSGVSTRPDKAREVTLSKDSTPKSGFVTDVTDDKTQNRYYGSESRVFKLNPKKVKPAMPSNSVSDRNYENPVTGEYVENLQNAYGVGSPLTDDDEDLWGKELSKLKGAGVGAGASSTFSVEGESEGKAYFQRIATEKTNQPVAEIKPSRVRSEISIDHDEFLSIVRNMIDEGLLKVGLPTVASDPSKTEGYVFRLDDLDIDSDNGEFVLSFEGSPMEADDPHRAFIDAEALSNMWPSDPDVSSVFGIRGSEKVDSDRLSELFRNIDNTQNGTITTVTDLGGKDE